MFKLGNEYNYTGIEDFTTENDLELIEYGPSQVGTNFLVIEAESTTWSFVLTGAVKSGYVYKCIYSE